MECLQMIRGVAYIILAAVLVSCGSMRRAAGPDQRFPASELREDYSIFQGALEELHPSLYWFTPKDSMDFCFRKGMNGIPDSMTERQFRMLLIRTVTAIRCGHTTVNYSKRYAKYIDTARVKVFPLAFKVLGDTLAVTANLHKGDTILKRGTIVTAINERPAKQLVDTFLQYIAGDGFSATGRYQALSSYGTFGVMYKNIFGLPDTFRVGYLDEYGHEYSTTIPVFIPPKDSTTIPDSLKIARHTPRDRKKVNPYANRYVQVDTTLKSGYMVLNTFARGNRLRKFFRSSFKTLERIGIEHLVVDVRSNGGGDAGNAILLTRFLSDHPFVIADSLYAVRRSSRYRDHIPRQPLYWLTTLFITRKRSDGNFHFGYFERHRFKPVKKNHFNGKVYIMTGGNSFSATTVFVEELKEQSNVLVIGEETGGGAYGNTAWIIPELVLPNTRLRVSIPRFRFVMRKELVEQGRGIIPHLSISPDVEDIRKGIDIKLEAVKYLIMRANGYY